MNRLAFLIIIMLACYLPDASAAVGKVLYRQGTVNIERPQVMAVRVGMPVDAGDVLATGPEGYVQLLLDDRTKVAVRPESRFTVVALERPAGTTGGAIGTGGSPRTEFMLEQGGFRTLTGDIAEEAPSAYQVSTPAAEIRIRGTNYVARFCQGDCGQGSDNGLYVGVSEGTIFLANDGGELDLARNQFGYARDFTVPPVRLIAPPATLRDEGLPELVESEEEEEESTEAAATSGEDSEDDQEAEDAASEFGAESDVAETESTAGSTEDAAAGQATTEPEQAITAVSEGGNTVDLTDGRAITPTENFSFASASFATGFQTSSVVQDDAGNVTAFQEVNSDGETVSYDIRDGAVLNAGFDPITEIRWGRWSEGTATSGDEQFDASQLHYAVALIEDTPTQVIMGSADYTLVGNTDPTDNLGNVGILGTASLSANFTNQTVASDLSLGINNQVWNASGTATLNLPTFNGVYNSVIIDGLSGGTGTFGGFFSGFSDLTPLGAALNYNLNNGSGTTVTGAAVFNRSSQ